MWEDEENAQIGRFYTNLTFDNGPTPLPFFSRLFFISRALFLALLFLIMEELGGQSHLPQPECHSVDLYHAIVIAAPMMNNPASLSRLSRFLSQTA